MLFWLCPIAAAVAEEKPPPPSAAEILKQTHAFFSSLKSLACEIDFVRVANSRLKYREQRAHFDAAFQRPNLLSILMKDESTVTYAWISDGESVSTYLAGIEKYTKKKAPADLDALLSGEEMYVVKGSLEDAFFLDDLVRQKASPLPGGASGAEYVGLEELNGQQAHHLRLIRKPSSWDVWISAGTLPLPLKIFGDISDSVQPRQADTKTEFTVEFKHWLPDTALDSRVFQFDPSSKAKRVSGFLKEIPPHPLLNQAAPAAALNLIDGRRTSVAAHRGRDIVVLDFWAIGCVPCVGLLPKVAAVAKKFSGRGVVVYAMNENDAPEDVREFLKLKGIGLTATVRNKETNFPAYKVDSIPQTFVIDANGIIRAVHGVMTDDLEKELSDQLEALLAGRELPKHNPNVQP
jgi:peroxiredoxin